MSAIALGAASAYSARRSSFTWSAAGLCPSTAGWTPPASVAVGRPPTSTSCAASSSLTLSW
ncbi:MAG: hypothetical protein ACRC42_01705 [Mycoplasma sp.]